jgi:ligand-binding sensor domain-containing protein/serine phosphatase RsbU (regulator of sigma subunit)
MISKTRGNKYLRLLLAFLWCGIVQVELSATDVLVSNVEQFSINEGLTSSSVTTLFEDSRGFLWVGTQNGLNRYDGYGFRTFNFTPLDSSSISGNFIQSIDETTEGHIWVATKDNGISIWNRYTDRFIALKSLLLSNREWCKESILGMQMQEDKKKVWILTSNMLVEINPFTFEFKEYEYFYSVFKSGKYDNYPITFRGKNEVWIGSKDGVYVFNAKEADLTRLRINGTVITEDVSDLRFLNDTTLFIGTANGLKKMDLTRGRWQTVWAENSTSGYLPINTLLENNMDQLWIGSSRGLEMAKPPYYFHSLFNLTKGEGTFLMNKQVTAVLPDKSGVLWVGTKFNGLYKVMLGESKIRKIDKESDLPYTLNSYNFTATWVDKEGILWLGTQNDGLYRIDRKRQQARQFHVNRNIGYGMGDEVTCILEDENNYLWLGTPQGIFKLNKSNGVIREFDYAGSSAFTNLLGKNKTRDILKDRLGDIWIATDFGLYKYDGKTIVSYFEEEGQASSSSSLCSNVVNALYEDKQGWIWIGTKNGVNYLRRSGEFFQQIRNTEGEPLHLSSNNILSFAEDNDNRIWIGTSSGISYYDKSLAKSGFSVNNSALAHEMICGILIDDYNRVWASTNNGISYISPGGNVISFTTTDGLAGYTSNVGSYHKTNQELFFGGVHGLSVIQPDSLQENRHIPNVVITAVEVYHKGKLVEEHTGELEELALTYRKNTMIHVRFAGLEFTQPRRNWYKVKLENYDEDWRAETQVNSVNFSNLSSGKYTLKVLGANNDFVWNTKPTELKIAVTPPLWMSNYAYGFYFLAAFFLIQSLINYRIRNYRKAYKNMEEKAHNQKQIEAQKEALSKINQSLTDSISYAKRIQEAIIPSEQIFKTYLPDSFIYFRPKDIVSGDFYWVYYSQGRIYVAVVDCTGHGVPGAFMSIIGYELLRNIVEIQGVQCPAEILNRLNDEVLGIFKKNDSVQKSQFEVNDGMDLAFIMIDKERKMLEFAGAYNPLYLIRDNEILTYKGNRFPVGHDTGRQFEKEEIQLMDGDMVYLFSDGFADQFGGPEGKKFKYRRFRHLLLNIHKLPIEDQKAILHQKMEDWMNSTYEQIDDILLVGMQPLK